MMAGIDMTHVPYRGGGQVMTDLIAGQVQVSFIGMVVNFCARARRDPVRRIRKLTAPTP